MEEKQLTTKKSENLIIENRERLTASGILDVEAFSTEKIVLLTQSGTLTITGKNMRIKKLNSESKDTIIEGKIDGSVYTDGKTERESFLKRVLK